MSRLGFIHIHTNKKKKKNNINEQPFLRRKKKHLGRWSTCPKDLAKLTWKCQDVVMVVAAVSSVSVLHLNMSSLGHCLLIQSLKKCKNVHQWSATCWCFGNVSFASLVRSVYNFRWRSLGRLKACGESKQFF